MPTQTQLPDGRWVPAQPVPFYRDTRPWYLRLWHCCRAVRIGFIKDRDKRHKLEDDLEKDGDEWMVPVEPYTKNGKWYSI